MKRMLFNSLFSLSLLGTLFYAISFSFCYSEGKGSTASTIDKEVTATTAPPSGSFTPPEGVTINSEKYNDLVKALQANLGITQFDERTPVNQNLIQTGAKSFSDAVKSIFNIELGSGDKGIQQLDILLAQLKKSGTPKDNIFYFAAGSYLAETILGTSASNKYFIYKAMNAALCSFEFLEGETYSIFGTFVFPWAWVARFFTENEDDKLIFPTLFEVYNHIISNQDKFAKDFYICNNIDHLDKFKESVEPPDYNAIWKECIKIADAFLKTGKTENDEKKRDESYKQVDPKLLAFLKANNFNQFTLESILHSVCQRFKLMNSAYYVATRLLAYKSNDIGFKIEFCWIALDVFGRSNEPGSVDKGHSVLNSIKEEDIKDSRTKAEIQFLQGRFKELQHKDNAEICGHFKFYLDITLSNKIEVAYSRLDSIFKICPELKSK